MITQKIKIGFRAKSHGSYLLLDKLYLLVGIVMLLVAVIYSKAKSYLKAVERGQKKNTFRKKTIFYKSQQKKIFIRMPKACLCGPNKRKILSLVAFVRTRPARSRNIL